jgi:archaeal type IV pilus assembly protein PilA
MNVFGHRERSWRKAQKRAVSPIIATILLVAITVVLAAVLYVLISGLTHGPGSTPIGSAFSAGTATPSTCGTGSTYAAKGCLTGDYIYTVAIASSTVTFGSVLFEVKTSAGSVLTLTAGAGGFTVESTTGAIAAQSPSGTAGTAMAMTTAFTPVSPLTSSSSLTSLYTIVIDMGTANPAGQGYSFVVLGTGSFSGSTNPVSLP